ncbi:hypothetical protein J2W22_003694 [Sphingomonas kyeonggiensis]|nr:hypothetical protein [Sphingomonas kyeonggiensis]
MRQEKTIVRPIVSFCPQVPHVLRNPGYSFRRHA